MGHAISNLALGVGHSFLRQSEGVGHVFFINQISKCSGPPPPSPTLPPILFDHSLTNYKQYSLIVFFFHLLSVALLHLP